MNEETRILKRVCKKLAKLSATMAKHATGKWNKRELQKLSEEFTGLASLFK